MSVEAPDGEVISPASRLRDALIALGRLTPDSAVLIEETMRRTGLGYGEAALRLGIVTPAALAEATEAARQLPPKSADGIVEGALHKMSLTRGLPVKYVGMVEAGPSIILLKDPDSAYSEQIRALRTELLLLNSSSRTGTLLVMLSPCRGEGRSQLCAELAVAFSQLGQRTLLVDADLQRPRMHTLFTARHPYDGLGQALESGGIPELLSVEKLPHLSILMAGPSVPNPLELLTNGHFQRQMSDWRKKYSIIIIDTPPISEFADGLAIAAFAEQVLIVSRAGTTPHMSIKEMLRRMGGTQSRIVGTVFNRF